jgi:hypothetical protein
MLKEELGTKFVRMEVKEDGNGYEIDMPYGHIEMIKTVGGDGVNPIMMLNNKLEAVREDPRVAFINNFAFCTTLRWRFKDHDLDLEYHNVSGCVGRFVAKGDFAVLEHYDNLRRRGR